MYKSRSFERNMFYGAKPDIFERAKELRQNMTLAEQILWQELHTNKLKGFRFKPQHPIAFFIADFYCHKAKLVIEVDGDVHHVPDQSEYDEGREYELNEFGLTVLRFSNEEVLHNIKDVVQKILARLLCNPASPLGDKG